MTSDRIVGGQSAPSPIPWQVCVRAATGHFCGGTILDAKTIMSAAHCFNLGQSMSGYYIMAGATNKYDESGQTISIADGVWSNSYPYDATTSDNDFVILKLSSSLVFNENVQPACLPNYSSYAPEISGQTCYVSGWGALQSGTM